MGFRVSEPFVYPANTLSPGIFMFVSLPKCHVFCGYRVAKKDRYKGR